MTFEAGDVVALVGDDSQMVIVSKLDARLMWVSLKDSDREDLYAFRTQDLRLISRASAVVVEPVAFSTVPQIPRPSEVIAA